MRTMNTTDVTTIPRIDHSEAMRLQASELERALVGGLPQRGREELERLIAVCETRIAKRRILRPVKRN